MIRIVFSKDNSNCYLENTLEKEEWKSSSHLSG